jgi:choline kinase
MVEVGGRAILDWQLEAMEKVGIRDVAVIRGYRGEAIQRPGLRFFENPDYPRNNILGSLLCAEPALAAGGVVSYSDILYGVEVLETLLASDADIAAVVDVIWQEGYAGREGHPLAEAELVRVEAGRVVEAGKGIPAPAAYGEFIGLMKLTARGATTLREHYHRARAAHAEVGGRFHRAATFEQAYLTDMFQELAAHGVAVTPVGIRGGWMEIDVSGDLERARRRWGRRRDAAG